MNDFKIADIEAREILDSRGNPTVETKIVLENGTESCASVPSGASTGSYEARELRDKEEGRYGGLGVLQAVGNVNVSIRELLRGEDCTDQAGIDRLMCGLDGTENKSRLGANAILSVSLACAKTAAEALGIPLYRYIGGIFGSTVPTPMMNILNGGKHAGNGLDIQEFMIIPMSAPDIHEAVRMGAEIFHSLGKVVRAPGVGDEGGYAPELEDDRDALEALLSAVKKAGYTPGTDVLFAIDAAAAEWHGENDGNYYLPKRRKMLKKHELVKHWSELCEEFPIISIEDGMGEDDWEGWQMLTEALGGKIQLVGDDLFVTNARRLEKGRAEKAANAVLIKPNQIGTLTETMKTIKTAQKYGYKTIISHRSGETEDTSIADIAVGVNAGQIKTGAPSRTDRTAKYNRLMAIEDMLGGEGRFSPWDEFKK